MWRWARAPNPVETPETGFSAGARASTASRYLFTRARVASDRRTFASWRATSTTSAKVRVSGSRSMRSDIRGLSAVVADRFQWAFWDESRSAGRGPAQLEEQVGQRGGDNEREHNTLEPDDHEPTYSNRNVGGENRRHHRREEDDRGH